MSGAILPRLPRASSSPAILGLEGEHSPRVCDRCSKRSILSSYNLGKTSVVLNLCIECVRHYNAKQIEKGGDLSYRDFTPRHGGSSDSRLF